MRMRYNRGMVASKTVSDWAYWLFLYFIACVPTALLGGNMASSFVYVHDHYHRLPHYEAVLNFWECIAAVACAAPGFIWVGVSQLRGHRKEQLKQRIKEAADADDTASRDSN